MNPLTYHDWSSEVASHATNRRIDLVEFNGVSTLALKAYEKGRSPKEFLEELLEKTKKHTKTAHG